MTERVGPGDGFAEKGAALIRERTSVAPEVGIIAGTGLAGALSGLGADLELPFTDLPGFPAPSVPGHPGRLVVGDLAGVPAAAFLGRIHHYEGHPMDLVTLPVRLAAALGARTLVSAAAVGALADDLEPGMLVVGADHLNLLGEDPLRGWKDAEGRPPFVNLDHVYDRALAERAVAAAEEVGLPVARGVYAAVPGPTYETPAEASFIRAAGATVVGMSVVPETVAAAALGLRCLGLYCVTNRAASKTDHDEVVDVAASFAPRLSKVLMQVFAGED